MKFDWDKFKNGKVAVWCDTEEKAQEFVNECFERNIRYYDNSRDTGWDRHRYDVCYSFYRKNLCYSGKNFFINEGCEIIKWESGEDMKFKVGDKVVHRMCGWKDGSEYKTIKSHDFSNGNSKYELSDSCVYWFEEELELYKEPTEFTFQEVIARIKPGEVWESRYRVVSLNGSILSISYKNIRKIESRDLRINLESKFKLQETKMNRIIYKVEHQKNGKIYDFLSSQWLQEGEFVVCDTCKGESYGRVIDTEGRELTESEIKQYKECWRA